MNSPKGFERRKQKDRREAPRPGKWERRRNRCGGCQYFSAQGRGFCNKHQHVITAEDFACVLYAPQTP